MWHPLLVFILNRFYRTQNNFGSLNYHIIAEFSLVVTMAPTMPSTDFLQWPVTSPVAIVMTIVIEAYLPYQITHN